MKFFGPPTTKWRPCKIFAKLNGNHLLMANIFKLHEYQTFGLMKMHNMCKIWFANNIFSLWKRLVYDWRTVENAIFYFLSFPFTQISKDYCQKSYNGFWSFLVISTTSQIFLICIFLKMKRRHFYFFSICTDMHFGSLLFLNERNMTTSLLMIHLKYAVVYYTNLNGSSKNKPFLNYGSLKKLLRFFRFLIYVYFNKAFVKLFMK